MKNGSKPYNELPPLPPQTDIETKTILNQAIRSNRELARLKGYCSLLPNDSILLSSIILKEAKTSSEIENIVTTQDELYKALANSVKEIDIETKEVLNYRSAIWTGFNQLKEHGFLSTNIITKIQSELEGNTAGIRKLPGTTLVNQISGKAIYTPPDNEEKILELLKNLEKYINEKDEVDPLIKMAVIHYQFESIHPFYDGNGRTGRILNVLYLILQGLLDKPILYLSEYIIRNKTEYYELLQNVRDKNGWEAWILYMLKAVEITSIETLNMVSSIVDLLNETTELCRENLPKTTYSKELIDLLFVQPYTKIEFLVSAGLAERRTASKYLKQLEEIGILESFKSWKETIYVNKRLYDLLKR
ncbi:Fic family protein [Marispirochaeta sp.]|uniref:Fic family protein n=1 Tax=Marispirochaeta sp. TaxID=2038653 RepID=UPI0029C7C753|nr:Fic family protein [Marispirochaeta sp.]